MLVITVMRTLDAFITDHNMYKVLKHLQYWDHCDQSNQGNMIQYIEAVHIKTDHYSYVEKENTMK